MESAFVSVREVVDKPRPILHSDGIVLYEYLSKLKKRPILLSFKGIELVTTAFLNASIGKIFIEDPLQKIEFEGVENELVGSKINYAIDLAISPEKRSQHDKSVRKTFYSSED